MEFLIVICALIIRANCLDTPIIGILTQENFLTNKPYPEADSYIAASYVKHLESSGARVLPIWIRQDEDYYKRVINYTNGILFPGGATYFKESNGYGEAAKILYKIAIETNKDHYYPILGICLGMEVIIFAAMDGKDLRQNCSAVSISLPLKFTQSAKQSRIFEHLPLEIMTKLETTNLTYNYHRYCLFEDVMNKNGLLNDWDILSTNIDTNNVEFISTMEHRKYPFYGLQYHPEKNPYEFKSKDISHNIVAIQFSQYLSNFFVNECRKNNHTFPSSNLEKISLIYNYSPVYSVDKTSYEQVYLFYKEDYVNNLLQ